MTICKENFRGEPGPARELSTNLYYINQCRV